MNKIANLVVERAMEKIAEMMEINELIKLAWKFSRKSTVERIIRNPELLQQIPDTELERMVNAYEKAFEAASKPLGSMPSIYKEELNKITKKHKNFREIQGIGEFDKPPHLRKPIQIPKNLEKLPAEKRTAYEMAKKLRDYEKEKMELAERYVQAQSLLKGELTKRLKAKEIEQMIQIAKARDQIAKTQEQITKQMQELTQVPWYKNKKILTGLGIGGAGVAAGTGVLAYYLKKRKKNKAKRGIVNEVE